jgi:uncharacterized membrane protein
MFDQVNGIPAHPLFVHAPLVLIALTLALSLIYVVLPPLRRRFDWALVLLAVVSPISAFFATESGEKLEHRIGENSSIEQHSEFGETTRNLSLLLLVVVVLLVVVDRFRNLRTRVAVAESAAADSTGAGHAYAGPAAHGSTAGGPATGGSTAGGSAAGGAAGAPAGGPVFTGVADKPGPGVVWTAISWSLCVVLLGVGTVTGVYLYRTGDSGAKMVWENSE